LRIDIIEKACHSERRDEGAVCGTGDPSPTRGTRVPTGRLPRRCAPRNDNENCQLSIVNYPLSIAKELTGNGEADLCTGAGRLYDDEKSNRTVFI